MRRIGLVIAVTLCAAGSLAAQAGIGKGTVEVGGIIRYTKYPKVLGIDSFPDQDNRPGDGAGWGGRLGYFVARNLEVEANASYGEADRRLTRSLSLSEYRYLPIHLQLVYNAPIGEKMSWMFGGGANYTRLREAGVRDDFGATIMTGLRLQPSHRIHVRLEGVLDYLPKGFGGVSNTYLAAQGGVSLMFGGHVCNHGSDMVSIQPTSATLAPGGTQAFSANATYCGGADQVVYRLTGPGRVDSMTGMYTATTVGSAQVIAYSRRGKMTSAATVTIAAPVVAAPPPPPPPRQAPPPPPPTRQAPPPPPHYNFDLAMVHFRFDHADLTKGGEDTVKAIAATLVAHGEVNVDVVGHTDWIGTSAYNMKLSQARAETVHRLLVKLGIADSRIVVKWRGKDEPLADNKTKAGRDMNRRVEVKQNN